MQNSSDTTRTQDEYIEAQHFWRELCASHDAEDAYHLFVGKYPTVPPEAFRNDHEADREGRWRYQKARELVYGKQRDGARTGGDIGRLRVLTCEPLRQSVLHFRQVEKLRPLQFDIFSQFSVEQMDYIGGVLADILPSPAWYVVEMGRTAGLHAHVLHGESVKCPGATCRTIPDHELLRTVEYIVKRPAFNFDSAFGYITVRQAQGRRVASRHSAEGLDARRVKVSLQEIEAILGVCPGSNPEVVTRTLIRDKIPTSDTYPIRAMLAEAV